MGRSDCMWKDLLNIFLAFFRSSILSYGGGPASIPLMQKEIVDNYKWFTNEQFVDALAIGNALPGPIAPKMAAYVGNHVAGTLGAVIGVAATVVPTALLIVLIANFLLAHKDSTRIKGMLTVAKPMVVVLLIQTVISMLTRSSYPNITAYIVSVVAFVLVMFLKVNPAFVVIGGLAIGFIVPSLFLR